MTITTSHTKVIKMRKILLILIVTMTCFLSGCQTGRTQPNPSTTQAVAAREGLATLKQVVNANNYAALGFRSLEEVSQATLGEPLQIYQVRLDTLRAFADKTDPETLLADPQRSLYPVHVNDRVATSIFVTGSRESWRATEFGNAAVAQLVSRQGRGPGNFIVHVPALQAYFVGDRASGKLTLTPVMDDPRTQFRAGETLPADVVFTKLQAAASGYNGLPQ
jgi:hypothetical protein